MQPLQSQFGFQEGITPQQRSDLFSEIFGKEGQNSQDFLREVGGFGQQEQDPMSLLLQQFLGGQQQQQPQGMDIEGIMQLLQGNQFDPFNGQQGVLV